MAPTLTSVSEIERKLASLRLDEERAARLRTSVMTHIAWVPEEWVEAAEDVLAGLAERHPSRTIVLFPQSGEGGLEGEVSVESFGAGENRSVCTDTIRIHLHGTSAEHPGSVVEPLLITDLPVFLRWRGVPAFGDSAFEELVDVVDRLIVDSTEWPDLPRPYRVFGYPAVPVIFLLASLGMIVNALVTDPVGTGITFGIIAAGIPVYYVARVAGQIRPVTHEPSA